MDLQVHMAPERDTAQTNNESYGPGPRTRLRRNPQRGVYDSASVHAVIDEAPICHVSFVLEGEPVALPMAHARLGGAVYFHGAVANRMLKTLASGVACCLSFTLVDGLVLARSAFHHSMNFRSVVALGRGQMVTDVAEKRRSFAALLDHVVKGRSADVPESSSDEVDSTLVVRVAIDEASLKIRRGPPSVEADAAIPTWSGVVPLSTMVHAPVRDPEMPDGRSLSASVAGFLNASGAERPAEVLTEGFLLSTDRTRLDMAMVHGFLSTEAYWDKGVSAADLATSLSRSLCAGAYLNGVQIGFARLLADGSRFGYLADVFIVTEHRGHGYGKRLVQFILEQPQARCLGRIVLGTEDAHGLYTSLGFELCPAGKQMILDRR